MNDIFVATSSIILGYVLGSIPFGLLLTRIAGVEDIRSIGSGNIGATNVLRTGNKYLALLTFILDASKAIFAIVAISILFNDQAGAISGLAAFIGHIFPIWLKFKGGKGVSTYVGILIALKPYMIVFFAIPWILSFIMTRYSSISSLLATFIINIMILITSSEVYLPIIFTLMTIIVYLKHIDNINRLISKSETKITFRKNDNDQN